MALEGYTEVYRDERLGMVFCAGGIYIYVGCVCTSGALFVPSFNSEKEFVCDECDRVCPVQPPFDTVTSYSFLRWRRELTGPSPREWVARWLGVSPSAVVVSIVD